MAKKFSFRLEPLLKLRANAVEQAKNALGIAYTNRQQKQDELHRKEEYLADILKIGASGTTQAMALEAGWHHRQATQAEIKALERACEQLLEIEDLKRRELAEAMKEEKILEKLKERKSMEYKEMLAKEEQAFLDEIASRRGIAAA
ncbi:MAG: flagellar export protein FliJ [Candidatus Kapaibacterium sp.]